MPILERERAMVFPDYYFFAERRLVNHTIETRKVKNFDDCELLCYLNDNCVSLNFKKDPDNNKTVNICELNNATHLKYDTDLKTDANFFIIVARRWVINRFLETFAWNNIKTMRNVHSNLLVFDHLIFCFNNNTTTKIFYSHYSGTTRSKKKK